jgi:multiple sugar transport system ATP-binding protein
MPQGETGMKITIEHLTKQYGDFKAVDDLNLEIQDGELVGLLGPSGCGKSTTLFMLSGLTEPSGGRILFGDNDVTTIPPEDREIGLVFQNYALYPHMTVLENIMFPLINRKVPKAEARDRAEKMAEVVHLEGLLHRKPKALSGGQQQRVAIARALVKRPKVLLLDEPLSNLDAKLRVETREEIRRIQQEVKITTIFVTHDQEEAMSISDRIAVMDKGVLQQYEKPQEMYLNPVNEFVANFLGMPQINMFEGDITTDGVWLNGHLLRPRQEMAAGQDLPNGRYRMGIRPENFELVEQGLAQTASHVRMTGRDLLVFFRMDNTEMRLLAHSDRQLQRGSNFAVRVRPGQLCVFGADGKTLAKV